MTRGGLPIDATARARSLAALVAAAFVGIFALAGVFLGERAPLVVGARVAWIVALVATSRVVLRARGRRQAVLMGAAALLSIAALYLLTVADGVAPGGSLTYLVAAPLFVAILLPDATAVTAVAGVASTTLALLAGVQVAPPGSAARIAIRAAAAAAFAVLTSRIQARIRRDERGLEEERARALDALRASEHRRAETEPFVRAGSQAGRLAHDMANPLAAVKCNLEWLRDAAEAGRLQTEEGEVLDVLAETQAAIEQLGARLGELRASVQDAARTSARRDGPGPAGGGGDAGGH
jgi:signal transduction histidine kinase